MRRQILLLTTNVVAIVLLTICIVVPAYAQRRGRAGDGLPSPWVSQDIGAVGVVGSATASGNTFTVQGSGTDVWYKADQFRYMYQPLQGDGVLLARVDSQNASDAWAKAGIMIRETLNPDSAYAFIMVTPGNGLAFQGRMTTGGLSSHQLGATVQAPYWLELMRQGNNFTAYASSDGQTWTQVGSPITINMSTNAYVGLAVTAHNNAVVNIATFSNVSPSSDPLVPPLTQSSNLALNTSASASSYIPGSGPGNALDGNGATFWENAPNDIHPWITVDLGADYPVSRIGLSWLDSNTRTFTIQGSRDGKTWTTITFVEGDTKATDTLDLTSTPTFARYFRLVVPKNTGSAYKLAEFSVYGGIALPPGAQGPIGPQGVQGVQGVAGPQGTVGPQGVAGPQGTVGPQGPQGIVGPQGVQGVQGVLGPQGIVGPQGVAGPQGTVGPQGPSGAINLALNRPVISSSDQNEGTQTSNAVDGSLNTYWSSGIGKPVVTLQVDLGSIYAINEVKLFWGSAYAQSYQIQVSNDGTTWSWIYSTINGPGGTEDLTGLSGSGRYIRIYATGFSGDYQNYSLGEFQVYGSAVGPRGPEGDEGLQGTPGPQGPTGLTGPQGPQGSSGSINLALNRPVTASTSDSDPAHVAQNAVDGDLGSRWSSNYGFNTEWLQIDLGARYAVNEMKVYWESAYALGYQIQVSDDASTWTTIYTTATGNGGTEDLNRLSGSGRYIRVYMTQHHGNSNISIYEIQVYGSAIGPQGPTGPTGPTGPAGSNLALNATATSSSNESSILVPQNAVDGDLTTRWSSSQANTTEWLQIDLRATYAIDEVKLYWEAAYGVAYQLQVSNDATNWTMIHSTTAGTGGIEDLTQLSGSGRYIRVYMTGHTSNLNFSLYEVQVYGSPITISPTRATSSLTRATIRKVLVR